MFIGHYSAAFVAAASRRAPRLGALFVAAQLVDFGFFGLVLAGVEHMREVPGLTLMNPGDFYDMRFTHSLLGTLAWAAGFAVALRVLRYDWRAAYIGAAVVVSHWLLDLLVHAPDLTLAGHGRRFGLGLWNRPALEMPLELGLVAVTFVFYLGRTRAVGWPGRVAPALLALALLAVQAINWFTPQPAAIVDPVPAATPVTALVVYALLALLAGWVARARRFA